MVKPGVNSSPGRPGAATCSRGAGRRQVLSLVWLLPGLAVAHGSRAGDVLIDHPYALPTPAGAQEAAVYFRALKNTGTVADRLLGAHTPVARAVQIQRGSADAGVQRRQAVATLDLVPGVELRLRHGGDTRLALLDVHAPLQDGDRFTITLIFERGGKREVTVWVQQAREQRPAQLR